MCQVHSKHIGDAFAPDIFVSCAAGVTYILQHGRDRFLTIPQDNPPTCRRVCTKWELQQTHPDSHESRKKFVWDACTPLMVRHMSPFPPSGLSRPATSIDHICRCSCDVYSSAVPPLGRGCSTTGSPVLNPEAVMYIGRPSTNTEMPPTLVDTVFVC